MSCKFIFGKKLKQKKNFNKVVQRNTLLCNLTLVKILFKENDGSESFNDKVIKTSVKRKRNISVNKLKLNRKFFLREKVRTVRTAEFTTIFNFGFSGKTKAFCNDKAQGFSDAIYDSTLLTLFINLLHKAGHKSRAKNLAYSVLRRIKRKFKKDPFVFLNITLSFILFFYEFRKKRIGEKIQDVLYKTQSVRKIYANTMRILINLLKSTKVRKYMQQKLIRELSLLYYKQSGQSVRELKRLYKKTGKLKTYTKNYKW